MNNVRRRGLHRLLVLAFLALCMLPSTVKANAVDDWSAVANQVIIVNAARGGTGNLDFAYVYIAIYDAVNAIDGRHAVFAVRPTTSPVGASPDAATAAAAYTVLKWLFPAQEPYLTGVYNLYVAGLPAAGKATGIAVGTEVGTALTVPANRRRSERQCALRIPVWPWRVPGYTWRACHADHSVAGTSAPVRDRERCAVSRPWTAELDE